MRVVNTERSPHYSYLWKLVYPLRGFNYPISIPQACKLGVTIHWTKLPSESGGRDWTGLDSRKHQKVNKPLEMELSRYKSRLWWNIAFTGSVNSSPACWYIKRSLSLYAKCNSFAYISVVTFLRTYLHPSFIPRPCSAFHHLQYMCN